MLSSLLFVLLINLTHTHFKYDLVLRNSRPLAFEPSPPKQSSPFQCRSICEWIVRALPISEDNPIWLRLVPPIAVGRAIFTEGPTRSAQLREWLISHCIHRFMVLHSAHFENVELTDGAPDRFYKSSKSNHSKKNLFSLDLGIHL